MYSKILIPIAPDHLGHVAAALELAEVLRAKDGKIILMSAIEAAPAHMQSHMPDDYLIKEKAEAVAKLQKDADGHGNTEVMVVTGKPSGSILEHAKLTNSDCIIIGSHKPDYMDYFIGSTAARVVRHAQCSVHVIR
ncbi:universal stress protein [Amylibacter sp. SFDW26]|uniref:universal stress protein n=1 Tax=Amylibacter sp. SFDW26 TaxID=2652722 RepID=UPI0018698D8F|nr:universal stress protein [Amylibacter sp. SFDW26]